MAQQLTCSRTSVLASGRAPCRPAVPVARPLTVRASSTAPAPDAKPAAPVLKLEYKHLLLPILDANPYLSDGSKQVRVRVCVGVALGWSTSI